MKDEAKTKLQLIQELEAMRKSMAQMSHRLAKLEVQPTHQLDPCGSKTPQHLAQKPTHEPENFQFPEHPQLRKIFAFIERNYCQSITLNEVAQAFGYTPSYLTSLVRRLTGQTLYQWIVQRRMFQARHLLLGTELPIYQVAETIGYLDTGHFVKHFRKLHGQPPGTWKDLQDNCQTDLKNYHCRVCFNSVN